MIIIISMSINYSITVGYIVQNRVVIRRYEIPK